MQFRTDISFLRAVAVIIVMLFHYGVFGFDGGFIGVDVFFVISGFLMTQITLSGFEKGTFSLKDFYARRVKRIFPALQIVLLFVLLISSIFFFQSDVRLNAKYTFLADFFVSNVYFWNYQNYFSSTNNILLHTWTLGVEWQFYIIYPLILLLLKRVYFNNKTKFWSILSLICLLSFLLMLYIGKSNTNFIFYMLPTRFWELSIGGLAFGIGRFYKPNKSTQFITVFAALIIIFLSTYFITESILWPSIFTLLPTLATSAILVVDTNYSIFKNPLALFLGNISYSLYLWHWPWYILFKYFGFVQPLYIIILIALSVLSAYLSYHFIETSKKIATLKFSALSTLVIAIIAGIIFIKPELTKPLSIYQNEKFEIGDFTSKYLVTEKEKQFNPCGCFVSDNDTFEDYNIEGCLLIADKKPNILLLGDSHSAQLSNELRNSLPNFQLSEASVGYNFPLIDAHGKPALKKINDFVFESFIPQNSEKIDLVIISAHWLMRTNSELNYSKEDLFSLLKKTMKFLESHAIPYLIIGQTETYNLNYPRILMLKELGRNESEFINVDALEMNNSLKNIISQDNYIDVYNSSLIQHYDENNKIPYMFDNNHLTTFGAKQMLDKLVLPRINKKVTQK